MDSVISIDHDHSHTPKQSATSKHPKNFKY